MLTEHFIASTGPPSNHTGPPASHANEDPSIFVHEYQPLCQQRQSFNKSATSPNCLAVSQRHIFAAQADKGIVHVYNRDKGNLEVTVPFTDKISSLVLACNETNLILGTVEGRIFLWEISSGRQIITGHAHLQAVTVLVVDPTGNFLLSASKDSTVHVWSLPALLSFSNTTAVLPLMTFRSHRAEITALVVGHSASGCNFAVSVSRDKTCFVWDYRSNNILRTYLLPYSPLCIALDPADRAVFLGYEGGNLQRLDLLSSSTGSLDALANGTNATEPVQPPSSSLWKLQDTSHGSALALSVSFDGTILISGHINGSILSWDTARGSFISSLTQAPLTGPVNNLAFLPVTGFADARRQKVAQVCDIVKPKFGAFDAGDGVVPGTYTLHAQFPSNIDSNYPKSQFELALTAPSLPPELLDESLSELAAWGKSPSGQSNGAAIDGDDDFMAFEEASAEPGRVSLQEENANLKVQLEALKRVQKKSFEKMQRLNEDKKALLSREQSRLGKTKSNGLPSGDSDEEMG